MISQAIGQQFRVSRGGCWQCTPDCRSRLAEVLTFSQVAYNGIACRSAPVRLACVEGRIAGKRVLYAAFSFSETLTNEIPLDLFRH